MLAAALPQLSSSVVSAYAAHGAPALFALHTQLRQAALEHTPVPVLAGVPSLLQISIQRSVQAAMQQGAMPQDNNLWAQLPRHLQQPCQQLFLQQTRTRYQQELQALAKPPAPEATPEPTQDSACREALLQLLARTPATTDLDAPDWLAHLDLLQLGHRLCVQKAWLNTSRQSRYSLRRLWPLRPPKEPCAEAIALHLRQTLAHLFLHMGHVLHWELWADALPQLQAYPWCAPLWDHDLFREALLGAAQLAPHGFLPEIPNFAPEGHALLRKAAAPVSNLVQLQQALLYFEGFQGCDGAQYRRAPKLLLPRRFTVVNRTLAFVDPHPYYFLGADHLPEAPHWFAWQLRGLSLSAQAMPAMRRAIERRANAAYARREAWREDASLCFSQRQAQLQSHDGLQTHDAP